MERYVILNRDGEVENIVIWDGGGEWAPPEGTSAIKESELDAPARIESTHSSDLESHEADPLTLVDIEKLVDLIADHPEILKTEGEQ